MAIIRMEVSELGLTHWTISIQGSTIGQLAVYIIKVGMAIIGLVHIRVVLHRIGFRHGPALSVLPTSVIKLVEIFFVAIKIGVNTPYIYIIAHIG